MKYLATVLVCLCILMGCGKEEKAQDPSQPEPATSPQVTEKPKPSKTTPNKLIDDPMVERWVRWTLTSEDKEPTGELTKADLEKVTWLQLVVKDLAELPKCLEKLTQLTSLALDGNQLTDVTGLEKLTKLKDLSLPINRLTEVPRGLDKLTQLTHLGLDGNKLTDVKGLEKLTQLVALLLEDNKLTDVKGLEKLTQLEELGLSNNPDLTKAQIAKLQKALPQCRIESNPKK